MKRGIKILLIVLSVIVIIIAAAAITMLVLTKKSEASFEQLIMEGPPGVEFSTIPDGEYDGSYSVFPVDVDVTVSVSGGIVTSIDILKHVNGQGKPAEAITGRILEKQSLGVDTVSGATFSSMVILKAVENALTMQK